MKDSTLAEKDLKLRSQARSFETTGDPPYIVMEHPFYAPTHRLKQKVYYVLPSFGQEDFEGENPSEYKESEAFYTILAAQVKNVISGFEVPDQEEVFNFLMEHDYLVSLLREAPSAIHEHFPRASLSLELVVDSETPRHEVLGLYISVSGDDQGAFDKLEALDQAWWLDSMGRARGSLFINLQYV